MKIQSEMYPMFILHYLITTKTHFFQVYVASMGMKKKKFFFFARKRSYSSLCISFLQCVCAKKRKKEMKNFLSFFFVLFFTGFSSFLK